MPLRERGEDTLAWVKLVDSPRANSIACDALECGQRAAVQAIASPAPTICRRRFTELRIALCLISQCWEWPLARARADHAARSRSESLQREVVRQRETRRIRTDLG